MFYAFVMISISMCAYEILSLILPLKFSIQTKILLSLILISGLAKGFLFVRTPTGFDIYELPYFIQLFISGAYNFIIVALFMLVIKDFIFVACKVFRINFPIHNASLFVLSLALCSTVYGTYEALKVPAVNTHEIYIENLGKEFDGMKIAMLVDIHADTLTDKNFVEAVVNKANALNPDLILIPGDFVDGQVKLQGKNLAPLKNLKSKFGVYGTTGNHEYYFDYEGWINEFPKLNVKILENENVIFTSGDSKLILAGVPDSTGGQMGLSAPNLKQALKDIPENSPIILMDHRPSNARENAKFNISLQVSGHTHGGQMPGIYYLVKRANKGFVRGWYDVEKMKLYVSPGTSQWNGFCLRLFDPSEITLFILRTL